MLSRTRLERFAHSCSGRNALRTALAIGLLIAGVCTTGVLASRRAASSPRHTLSVGPGTRLLVIAPHPDDELLAAGGVLQRVLASKGELRVVYLTDGEGFPQAVKAEVGRASPTPSDYRDYGRERKGEAEDALRALGAHKDSLTFLGFPNGGLHRLMTAYWSDRRPPYMSPYSRRDRPSKSEVIAPDTKFHGEDLTEELAGIIGTFKPTMILTPRQEDQHVDHCAAWFFVADALGGVARVDRSYRTDLLTYIVHYGSWPFDDVTERLPPPPGLSSGASGWLFFALTDREFTRKRVALAEYKTQMKIMDFFLEGFVRRNEVFSRPSPPRVVLPMRRRPCDQYQE